MNIRTKERRLTAVVLAAIGLIAAMILFTYAEVDAANRERQQAGEIARGLSQLRLLTFEYRLHHTERAKAQWYALSDRVDHRIANAQTSIAIQDRLFAGMRESRAAIRRNFAELAPAGIAPRGDAPLDGPTRLFEAQLLSQLLADEQDTFASVFRLTDIATERISNAQHRLLAVALSGLALIALVKIGVSWLIQRDVLIPVAQLQRAAQQIAAKNWSVEIPRRGDDEIGKLASNFGAMTKSLQESLEQVKRSNQDIGAMNDELEAFSYSVAHDLRAPLRSMDGFALVLLEDYADKLGDEGKDALNRIRDASQRMGGLIDDLLRLSQVTRADLRVTRLDLSVVASDIADAIDRNQPSRSVQWAIESGLSIRADPALMRIAMQNLLNNAWKFTGKTNRPVIRVGAQKRGEKRVYFVADNGAGFDMAHAKGLFGAFQRLHPVDDFPGTGIGLAIVQRIIRRHDGEIWAEAKEGEGATFFFSVKESANGSHEQDHPAG